MLLQIVQGLDAVPGLDHGVAVIPEAADGQVPHDILVLDDQHAFDPVLSDGVAAWLRDVTSRCSPATASGQVDLEDAPLARLTVDPDVPAALLHDAVDGRQAETGALSHRLGGEEGLEDAGLRPRRPSRSRYR